jgi:HTH-type transcriptional regulator / antitoxin HigA
MGMTLTPARVSPPGAIIRRELAARGWTQKDLAAIMGRPEQAISELLRGVKRLTPETALQLAAALGASADFWLNLETNYKLHLARQQHEAPEINRKSRLYTLAPVTELQKRGWIRSVSSIAELEEEVCAFLRIPDPETPPQLERINRRQSTAYTPEAAAEIAWIRRVEFLAGQQVVGEYRPTQVEALIARLLEFAKQPEDVAQIPPFLQAAGIHFVLTPHLPHTYLDGALLRLESHPLIALTLRHDRIDNFWFTLFHELAHLALRHEGLYLDNIEQPGEGAEERAANTQAREWLIPAATLQPYVAHAQPHFSRASIQQFAAQIERYPGIVVGRLQYEGHLPYKNLRNWLVKVSPYLAPWIDTAGPASV